MSLPSTPMFLPLGRGLNTQPDPRALGDGELAVAKDCQFVPGGLITRYPYGSHSSTISNIRKLVTYGDELIAFTKDTIYSWSPALSAWQSRGTYLAPKVTEKSVFQRTAEQSQCERAELSGVIVYAWTEQLASATKVYFAALDATTGAVVRSPVQVAGTATKWPRLQVLGTRILLFWEKDGDLVVKVINPTSLPSTGTETSTVQAAAQFGGFGYDVDKLTSTSAVVVWSRVTTTSYGYATVSDAGVVSASTKARASVGCIAVSVSHNGSFVGVVRTSAGANIDGDVLNGSLADVATSVALSTTTVAFQMTFAWSENLSGSDLIGHAIYSEEGNVSSGNGWQTRTNTLTSAGVAGTEATLGVRLELASNAFPRPTAVGGDGNVYAWFVFATALPGSYAQVQNSYFLYRSDGVLVAKSCYLVAGGFTGVSSPLLGIGRLPRVQSLGSDTYAWCGVERGLIPLTFGQNSYSARSPRDVRITFDSEAARRTVQLGKTLYIAGGQVCQFDGESAVELGFHVYPFHVSPADAAAGNLGDGDFAWSASVGWQNAQGEAERSASVLFVTATMAGGGSRADLSATAPVPVTLKQSTRQLASFEIWRTPVNPVTDSPRYLVTSRAPTDTGNNGYLSNDPSVESMATFSDNFSDTTLLTKETNPENGAVLESIAPPAASIIAASEDRLFLAGIADDPLLIWYSKLRGEGEVAQFNDTLTIRVPAGTGDITALVLWQETLIAFCERAIYALPGLGLDNTGAGQNYGPARIIAQDLGAVSQEAVAITPQGILFKSSKGWHLLGGAGVPQYIGGPIKEYDSDTVESIDVMENDQHVRILTSSRMLVLDYSVSPPQWAEWTIASRVSSCVYGGVHYVATTGTVYQQQTGYATTTHAMDIETAWIKMDQALGAKLVRRIHVLGEYRSAFDLRLRYAVDYNESDASGVTWLDDETWTVSPTTVGGPLEVKFGPSQQRCKAFKLRLTAYAVGSATDPPSGEALRLTGIGIDVAFDRRLHRNLPAAQKV